MPKKKEKEVVLRFLGPSDVFADPNVQETCTAGCNGTGRTLADEPCQGCAGTGKVPFRLFNGVPREVSSDYAAKLTQEPHTEWEVVAPDQEGKDS